MVHSVRIGEERKSLPRRIAIVFSFFVNDCEKNARLFPEE